MYIFRDMVQEGAVWPLQPAYYILLQKGAGLDRLWIYIVSDGLQERAGHSI
jgi:hypothetical protein